MMINIENINFFGLILMRMAGCILFNPITGRTNLPVWIKAMLIFVLSIMIYFVSPAPDIEILTSIEYMVLLIKEILLGFIIGHIITLFTSIVITAGEIMDMEIGIGMAKVFDPQTNLQIGLTSSFYNMLFMFTFFLTDCHLNLVEIFLTSYKVIPYGETVFFSTEIYKNMLEIAMQSIALGVKFVMPIIAIELMLEVGVGVLMKAVPQINVFVINIQLKLIVGLIMMIILLPVSSSFIQRLIELMFEAISKLISFM